MTVVTVETRAHAEALRARLLAAHVKPAVVDTAPAGRWAVYVRQDRETVRRNLPAYLRTGAVFSERS